jgi:hypothetical protein
MIDNFYRLDIRKFFKATSLDRVLFSDNTKIEEDRNYYIDFSSVRGGRVIDDLKHTITFFSPDQPTSQLFTGHTGCGKSTELRKLKRELEGEGFYVVYIESNKDLEMSDVDISDILLMIAHHIREDLNLIFKSGELESQVLKGVVKDIISLLQEDGIFTEAELNEFSFTETTHDNLSFNFSKALSMIINQIKSNFEIRKKLRNHLNPKNQIQNILNGINSELIKPAIEKINQEQNNKKDISLVIIIDDLEKIKNIPKQEYDSKIESPKSSLPEYLFVNQWSYLCSLECHVIYTMPLGLRFSNRFNTMQRKFKPKVLPMVKTKSPDGKDWEQGIILLHEMVLARAFPELEKESRPDKIKQVFDDIETLNRLCKISGGHIRNLLNMIGQVIKTQEIQGDLPISSNSLEEAITQYRSDRIVAIDPEKWDLLRQINQDKKVVGEEQYEMVVSSMLVYEYIDEMVSWFDVEPCLKETSELKLILRSDELQKYFQQLDEFSEEYYQYLKQKKYSEALAIATQAYHSCIDQLKIISKNSQKHTYKSINLFKENWRQNIEQAEAEIGIV